MTTPSKTQAKRELKRRKGSYCAAAHKAAEGSTTTVERAARAIATKDGTFSMGTRELRAIAGVESTPAPKAKPTPKATTTTTTPAKRKGGKEADPAKQAAWETALAICEDEGIDATGPKGGPTPEFWTVYKAVRAEQRNNPATQAA